MFDLKQRREQLKLSQDDVANAVKVSRGTVSKWESGDIANMKRDKIAALANLLRINPLEILGLSVDNISPITETVQIPVIGEIACGDPITADENIEGYKDEIASTLPTGTLFLLHARGDSMEPTIPNGSLVMIREQPDVEDGQIAAVLVDDDSEATLKRVRHQGNIVMLMPDNPTHTPILLTEDNPGRIIGRAVKFEADL